MEDAGKTKTNLKGGSALPWPMSAATSLRGLGEAQE